MKKTFSSEVLEKTKNVKTKTDNTEIKVKKLSQV